MSDQSDKYNETNNLYRQLIKNHPGLTNHQYLVMMYTMRRDDPDNTPELHFSTYILGETGCGHCMLEAAQREVGILEDGPIGPTGPTKSK